MAHYEPPGCHVPACDDVLDVMGRHVFGVVALIFAIVTLAWHVQLQSAWHLPGATAFINVTLVTTKQMFWAVATTIAFGLAAVAIFSGYKALLASRLLTLMLLIFGAVIWIPACIAAWITDAAVVRM